MLLNSVRLLISISLRFTFVVLISSISSSLFRLLLALPRVICDLKPLFCFGNFKLTIAVSIVSANPFSLSFSDAVSTQITLR